MPVDRKSGAVFGGDHVDPTPAGERDHSDLEKSAGLPQLTVRGRQFFIGHSEEPSCIHAPPNVLEVRLLSAENSAAQRN